MNIQLRNGILIIDKHVTCPTCFYSKALLEKENAEPGTDEYVGSIYCPHCESGLADLDEIEI